MITLTEWNEFKRDMYRDVEKRMESGGNGILCPQCSHSLRDRPGTLMSYPPKRAVYCDCGYTGYRIV